MRSRLVRLIPEHGEEASAIKQFFNHRLPRSYSPARADWLDIIEATHPLWDGVSSPKRELIRSILNIMNLEMLKRLRPTSRFDYSGASIGNLFLTGYGTAHLCAPWLHLLTALQYDSARLFTGSFEAAIYLLSSICAVPSYISVLPALNTNFAHHIAAKLADGTVITGQNSISHPSTPTFAVPGAGTVESPSSPSRLLKVETEEHDKVEDANLPGTLPNLRKPAIAFSKTDEEDLPARIQRLWYINPYGQKITIPANPRVLEALNNASCIIYSIGSLFTSIVPSLVLRGVGDVVASPSIRTKILILNGTIDRETGPSTNPFTALDFVAAIADACSDSREVPRAHMHNYWHYVTHIIYLDGPRCPVLDKEAFNRMGIESMRVYGRKDEAGRGVRYDAKALAQALEAIIGRKDPKGDKTRRNTLVG